jgi:hypothetical protein
MDAFRPVKRITRSPMSDEKTAPNPIIALLLLIGVSLGLMPYSMSAFRASGDASKPSSSASSAKGSPLVDVFDPIKQDLGCAGFPCKECRCTDVKFVIALVPDPDADGQASTYDEFLSTIEHAASDCGHTYIGHAIPRWQEEESSSSGRPRSSFHQPGSLVFRADPLKNGNYKYLVVLLVIESPIRGISIEAFTHSVRHIGCPNDPFESCELQPIRVIGPSYSGTKHTLIQGIDAARDLYRTKYWLWPGACVVTGSATAMSDLCSRACNVTWFRTVHSVREALHVGAITSYLRTDLSNLVILAESETAFGGSAAGLGDKPKDATSTKTSPRPKVVVFPRQIAAVRSAYLNRLGSENLKKSPFSSDRHLTNLDLTSEHPSPDIPKAASLKTSPVVNELVVRRLMDDLATSPAPYVAIIATDVRDTIFLAELVKRTLPTSQLILIEPHLMFARPEVAGFLRGALVASTYPLVSMTQKWTSPCTAESPIQFVSDAQQGTFNATLAQLCSDRLRDYRPPGQSSNESTPPVWISMIGRDGFWPVTTLRVPDDQSSAGSSILCQKDEPKLLCRQALGTQLSWCHHEKQKGEDEGSAYQIPRTEMPGEAMLLLSGLLFILPVSLFRTITATKAEDLSPKLQSLLHLDRHEDGFSNQRTIIVAFSLVAIMLAYYSFCHIIDAICYCSLLSILRYFLFITISLWVLYFVTPTCLHGYCDTLVHARLSSICAIGLGIIAFALSCLYHPSLGSLCPLVLFAHRETALLNGVSLFLPMIILCILVAIKSFTAICIETDRRPIFTKRSDCHCIMFRAVDDMIDERIVPILLGTLVAGLATWWMSIHWALPSISLVTPVFFVFFTYILVHAWFITTRVWDRWKLFRQTLSHVGTMAFLPAFDRLPQQFTARLGLYLDGHRPGKWFEDLRTKLREAIPDYYQTGIRRGGDLTEPEPPEWLKRRWEKRDPLSQLRQQGQQAIAKLDELRLGKNKEEYLADDIFALDVIDRLNWMARRLKFALAELLYTVLGLLLVVCSFPVPGQPYWVGLFVTWLFALGLGFIWIIFYCERDEVLSRIANTQPNRLSWSSEMIKSLAAFLIPVGLAITSVFPEVYESLVIMFQPLWSMFVRN